eukprot:CAMPEP_0203804922 /NCGR_PEP_ID=MMETSP0100_2-20121128/13897_1 /ASSEMBLY_ACC=CAM_ASM_000210 /TAXON_ID=96639 /ORGANISM=" , Strain NY0313808BC1" /LENGTH=299 /DNA_ID=CAMNT_0050713281 /DNA_START=900 /DNA_END=1800 /DNA_ORIENTATION=+
MFEAMFEHQGEYVKSILLIDHQSQRQLFRRAPDSQPSLSESTKSQSLSRVCSVKQVELDFAPTAAAFSDFMSHTGNIFSRQNNALVDLVSRGVPSILENQIDCKRDLESQLKLACESFIVRTYEQALAQLIAFLQRASKPLSDQTQVFQEQPFAKPDRVLALLNQCATDVPQMLRDILKSMTLYLANAQTQSILFKPIKANIFASISRMNDCIEANYDTEHTIKMKKTLGGLRTAINELEVDTHSGSSRSLGSVKGHGESSGSAGESKPAGDSTDDSEETAETLPADKNISTENSVLEN